MARPALIDRDAVLAAALAIADEGGVDALSMHGVARRLGVTPMALYRHVDSKAALLDGLVERLLAELPVPAADLSAEERLRAAGRGVRAIARHHPAVFSLLLARPATTPAAQTTRNTVRAALADLGVPDTDVPALERLISTMILGFAASEAAGRFVNLTEAEIDADFARLEGLIAGMLGVDPP